jgi:hypothetical protein
MMMMMIRGALHLIFLAITIPLMQKFVCNLESTFVFFTKSFLKRAEETTDGAMLRMAVHVIYF